MIFHLCLYLIISLQYKIRLLLQKNRQSQGMFLILHGDRPIFEYNFSKPQKLQTYFMIHASLDSLDNLNPKRREFYIGQLKNDDLPIFAYVNATGLRLLLVFVVKREYDKKAQAAIKDFLTEANKQLAIALMNPLYKQKQQIKSTIFKDRIEGLANEYLKMFNEKKK